MGVEGRRGRKGLCKICFFLSPLSLKHVRCVCVCSAFCLKIYGGTLKKKGL